ncbi:MAG TPA: hypothetical protein VGX24_09300 [Pyrinomonadaceae bacterium]|jgi:hypothetical protein|nr:hypothetical protein [Pyrinomonadaceae bacterium]
MRFICKTKIEKAWLVASVIIFITHRLLDASYPGYYSPAAPLRVWLELAMIGLSFPLGGLTLFALHSVAFWCDDCRSLEFLFDWSTLLFAGYIQWFWVLPEFLRNGKLTLLDLKQQLPETISPDSPTPAVEPASPAPLSAAPLSVPTPAAALPTAAALPAAPATIAAPCRASEAATFAPPLTEFDEAGLTALGRVFQAQSRPSAHASPAHVEAIFPRVN